MSCMEITPLIIENSTIGTTMNFTKFKNNVPNGLMYSTAISGVFINAAPARIPSTKPAKIYAAKGSFFFSFAISFAVH